MTPESISATSLDTVIPNAPKNIWTRLQESTIMTFTENGLKWKPKWLERQVFTDTDMFLLNYRYLKLIN